MSLSIQHLSIARNEKQIVSDLSFDCAPGECVVIRGKNGVGKSSVLSAIMGFSDVEVIGGDIVVDGVSFKDYKTHERARAGIFLSHQEPPVIDGITLGAMARASLEAIHGITEVPEAQQRIRKALATLNLSDDFAQKTLHGEMSGGEKKRAELFQMVLLEPKYVLLDELDSGLDAVTCDLSLKIIADFRSRGTGFVVVTHSDTFAEALKPTLVIGI